MLISGMWLNFFFFSIVYPLLFFSQLLWNMWITISSKNCGNAISLCVCISITLVLEYKLSCAINDSFFVLMSLRMVYSDNYPPVVLYLWCLFSFFLFSGWISSWLWGFTMFVHCSKRWRMGWFFLLEMHKESDQKKLPSICR